MLKPMNRDGRDYENYRWFFTSEGSLVIGGKSDEQNEKVIANFLKPDYTIMHTSAPGSPFMIIQKDNPSKKELEETAVFTACFSQQWKVGKRKIEIDVFRGEQIYKTKSMKTGTFGVRGDKKIIKVVPELVLVFQKGKLRAVPKSLGKKEEILAEIKPGKMGKEEASEKIAKKIRDKYHFPITKEEVMQAIPSDKVSLK
jgi:hypothetical protein